MEKAARRYILLREGVQTGFSGHVNYSLCRAVNPAESYKTGAGVAPHLMTAEEVITRMAGDENSFVILDIFDAKTVKIKKEIV